MNTIIVPLPDQAPLATSLAHHLQAPIAELEVRNFPDGESFVRIDSGVKGKKAILACCLFQPDAKFLQLYYLAETLREFGAAEVILVTPYLPYMRQDTRFNPGEAVTAPLFAKLLSGFLDGILSIDPHLHRITELNQVYSIPATNVHAAPAISDWVRTHIEKPVFIGPDVESKQWVSECASRADAPFIVLEKVRKGDKKVEVSVPKVAEYQGYTPVLVDDIISTARTMVETTKHLLQAGMSAPVCIGVHGIFAGDGWDALKNSGAGRIVTCNTIPHPTNEIDIVPLIASAIS